MTYIVFIFNFVVSLTFKQLKIMAKITLATLKSFINKNRNQLYIKTKSDFCGMNDCVMPIKGSFTPIKNPNNNLEKYTKGIQGAWFVGGGTDYFNLYEDSIYTGYEVFNSCGSFILAIKK